MYPVYVKNVPRVCNICIPLDLQRSNRIHIVHTRDALLTYTGFIYYIYGIHLLHTQETNVFDKFLIPMTIQKWFNGVCDGQVLPGCVINGFCRKHLGLTGYCTATTGNKIF